MARELGWAYVDKDTLATHYTPLLMTLLGEDPDSRDESAVYLAEVLPREYETLLAVVGDNLRLGIDVVVDAPFGQYLAVRDYLAKAADRHQWPELAEVAVLCVSCRDEVRMERLERRGFARDRWKLDHWDEFTAESPTRCEWDGVVRFDVDSTMPLEIAELSSALSGNAATSDVSVG
jgi:predicted kinase